MDDAQATEKQFIKDFQSKGGEFNIKVVFEGCTEAMSGKHSGLAKEVFNDIINSLDESNYQKVY